MISKPRPARIRDSAFVTTPRGASAARFGVGAAVLPRLQALGWVVEGQPAPGYEEILLAVRSGPDPDGTLHRLAALAEKGISLEGKTGVHLASLAAASKSLWDSLLRHPEWLEAPGRPGGDPRLYVQQRTIEIALADLDHRWNLETVTNALSDLADETVAFTLDQSRAALAEKFPGIESVPLAVIALGKWGGRELNYASDIDLLFVYEPGGGGWRRSPAPRLQAGHRLDRRTQPTDVRRDRVPGRRRPQTRRRHRSVGPDDRFLPGLLREMGRSMGVPGVAEGTPCSR